MNAEATDDGQTRPRKRNAAVSAKVKAHITIRSRTKERWYRHERDHSEKAERRCTSVKPSPPWSASAALPRWCEPRTSGQHQEGADVETSGSTPQPRRRVINARAQR